MTQDTNTASGAADKALAYLDDLSDDAAAHIFPSDLAKCMTSECVVEVCSVRAGNPNEKTVPLFSREQVVAALASAAAPAEQPSDLNLNCKSVQKRLATQWGFVPAMMYLELTDAMGYDSGEDGVTWSPEEWAAHLYSFYKSKTAPAQPGQEGEPVAWLSVDCIGERYLCFTRPDDDDPVRPLVFGDTAPPTHDQETPASIAVAAARKMLKEET